MNIGIDAKRIFFNHSGLGNYGRRFYRSLAQSLPDDSLFLYSPKPVAETNPYLPEMVKGNSLIVTPGSWLTKAFGGSFWRSGLINKQLVKDEIGIYYGLSNEIPYGIQKAGMLKVVVIHDLIFIRYPNLYPQFDRAVYRRKTRYACKNADHIIAASEQTRQDIINFYHVPGEKISILYPGSDPSFYAEKCTDSSGFFSTGRKYIISIGAITPRKNLLKTIEAFQLIYNKYDLDLVVIGTAAGLGRDYLATIKKFITGKGLDGRIHFLGNVPYKYVPDLCRRAELMVYPSQFEGFGMPIVEGMFSGIPVITSKGGCFPEAGGDGAIYINPDSFEEIADAVSKLMESDSLRKELVNKGLKHSARFRQDQIEASILALHRQIISRQKA